MRVLITRPEPDGQRTAAAVVARRHTPVLAPLLSLEPLPWTPPSQRPRALLITSANALRAVGSRLDGWHDVPLLAVGSRTAATARTAGFTDVRSAEGDAASIARFATKAFAPPSDLPLVHLAGADQAGDLQGALARAGLRVEAAVVYRMAAARRFSAGVRDQITAGTIDAVLHFSRRTAEAYLRCAAHAGLAQAALMPLHCCLSKQVAEPLAAAGANRIRIAGRPTKSAVLDCLNALPHEGRIASAL